LRESLSDDRELDERDEDSALPTEGGAECGTECECETDGVGGSGVYDFGVTGAGLDGAV
jgi:hypothetical protein